MDLIREMADAFVMLIRVGAVFRVVYCFVRIGTNEEESGLYKKRLRNTVVFYIIAEGIWQIKSLILGYFG